MMSAEQYRRLKPTFKKLISSEISKMVSRGTHLNMSIRDVIKKQNLEDKARDLQSAGQVIRKTPQVPPKLMTQSKLLGLLYDTSSQQSSEYTNAIGYAEGSNMQPYSPSQQNEDLMYNDPQPYLPDGMNDYGAQPQNVANANIPGFTQISMDQLILAAQRGEQPAILFSHAVQNDQQDVNGTQQNITEMNETHEMERRMLQNNNTSQPDNNENLP